MASVRVVSIRSVPTDDAPKRLRRVLALLLKDTGDTQTLVESGGVQHQHDPASLKRKEKT